MLQQPLYQQCDERQEYLSQERCHILEVSNGPEDSAVSLARARVAPGETTRWHRVVDTEERYFILSGQGRVEIGDDEPMSISVGDVVGIPAGVRQRVTNTADQDLVFLCICTPRFEWRHYEELD